MSTTSIPRFVSFLQSDWITLAKDHMIFYDSFICVYRVAGYAFPRFVRNRSYDEFSRSGSPSFSLYKED